MTKTALILEYTKTPLIRTLVIRTLVIRTLVIRTLVIRIGLAIRVNLSRILQN